MNNTVIQFSVQRMVCTDCGAEANASCNCGVSYVPKIIKAIEAIKANPGRSNVAIAREIGVDEKTVRKARASTSDQSEVELRVGLDGKTRRLPQREEPKTEPPRKREAFLVFSNEAMLLAKYEGPIDEEIIEAAKSTAEAWCRLVDKMEEGWNG